VGFGFVSDALTQLVDVFGSVKRKVQVADPKVVPFCWITSGGCSSRGGGGGASSAAAWFGFFAGVVVVVLFDWSAFQVPLKSGFLVCDRSKQTLMAREKSSLRVGMGI